MLCKGCTAADPHLTGHGVRAAYRPRWTVLTLASAAVVDDLMKRREPQRKAAGIYFVTPSSASIAKIVEDWQVSTLGNGTREGCCRGSRSWHLAVFHSLFMLKGVGPTGAQSEKLIRPGMVVKGSGL